MSSLLIRQGAIENRKRETMMVGLKEKTGRIGELESALSAVQLELERVEFSLRAKTSTSLWLQPTLAQQCQVQ